MDEFDGLTKDELTTICARLTELLDLEINDSELAGCEWAHWYRADVGLLVAETERLQHDINAMSQCNSPLMAGGTQQAVARIIGPCGTCPGCTARVRLHALRRDRAEATAAPSDAMTSTGDHDDDDETGD